jgi:hypothetical protein
MVDPVSGYAMEWAIEVGESKKLSPAAALVLVAAAYFANHKTGLAWCSRDELRAKTNMGHHRVIRAVAELEEAAVVPMRRTGNRMHWGPFPCPPEKGSTGARRLSTPPRGGGFTARTGARSDPVRVGRAVAASEVYRATGRAVTARTGAREQDRGESQNLRVDSCATCGDVGRVIRAKDERVVPCPECGPTVEPARR